MAKTKIIIQSTELVPEGAASRGLVRLLYLVRGSPDTMQKYNTRYETQIKRLSLMVTESLYFARLELCVFVLNLYASYVIGKRKVYMVLAT